ncbi:unnamed protein product [Sphagnum balticum]
MVRGYLVGLKLRDYFLPIQVANECEKDGEEGMLETDEGQEVAYNYAPGCSYDDTSGEELGLAVLSRHTKVLVTGNN